MWLVGWVLIELLAFAHFALAWTTDELALYDLVEEVGGSFYELFDIEKDASLSEVKKAYRRLSMEWHPDRNQAEDAELQFRRIAAIYEVLKSSEMREKYNDVLEFGLPDWRQPVYYFRRARKMSWSEAMLALFLICSAGHYLMLWGAYLDRYLTLSGKSRLRKKEIRQLRKQNVDAEDAFEAHITEQLACVRPTLHSLLPCLLACFAYRLAASTPAFCRNCYEEFRARGQYIEEIEEEDEDSEETVAPRKFVRPVPQPAFGSEASDDTVCAFSASDVSFERKYEELEEKNPIPRDQKWTCDELAHLVKLSTEKYPVGTPNRWERMAEVLNRTPEDVTAMVGKLKLMKQDEYAKLLRGAQSSAAVMQAANVTGLANGVAEVANGETAMEERAPSATPPAEAPPEDPVAAAADEWSQHDQRLFETALQQFPKGTADRWDKIVNCVPSKSRQQCVDRFKYLSEVVRQKKAQHRTKK